MIVHSSRRNYPKSSPSATLNPPSCHSFGAPFCSAQRSMCIKGGHRQRSSLCVCLCGSVSSSNDFLKCFHDCQDATFAGLVQEIVFLEVLQAFRGIQVASTQQGAAITCAMLCFKPGHQFPNFLVGFLCCRLVLSFPTSVLESNGDYSPGDCATNILCSPHPRSEPAGQSKGCVLVEMEIIAV